MRPSVRRRLAAREPAANGVSRDGFAATRPATQELGDVQSWAQSIENDMRTIASALEYVHQGSGAHLGPDGDDDGAD